jgi:hypothetical protein
MSTKMNVEEKSTARPNLRGKTEMQTLIPVMFMATGIVLMILKIYADSEPGAVPLLLIVTGAGWYVFIRTRSRWQKPKSRRSDS